MNSTEAMFSSRSYEWSTPQDLFDRLNEEFGFTLDVAASEENKKCEEFYSKEDNGLERSWKTEGAVWCNPPYGKGVGKWVRKAWEEWQDGAEVVLLIPARTDTKWFHEYILGKAEVRFLKGRLRFGGCETTAPFPSMVVVFNGLNMDEDGET